MYTFMLPYGAYWIAWRTMELWIYSLTPYSKEHRAYGMDKMQARINYWTVYSFMKLYHTFIIYSVAQLIRFENVKTGMEIYNHNE